VLHGRHALSDLCIDSSLLRWGIFFDEGRTEPGKMPTAYFFRNDFVEFSLAAQYPFQANVGGFRMLSQVIICDAVRFGVESVATQTH
jgi:hypothetical protein